MIDPEETTEPWAREEGAPPRPIEDALATFTTARGWARRLDGARVYGLWQEIAGEGLAQHTEPIRLHGGVLVVRAASSAWAAQIPYLAREIVERANAVLGPGSVTKVVVAKGPSSR